MGDPNRPLECIDNATLTPLVRQALGSETVGVTSWDTDLVHGGASYGSAGGSAVHRLTGHARDRTETREWSLILKVVYAPTDRGQPSNWDYWRREAEAYRSGFLDDLPGGLAAPRCFGVFDQPNGDCWVWMEDVRDHIGSDWPLERYGVVARHLGQFNGAYLTGGRDIPSWPWLRSSGWLRERVECAAPALVQLEEFLRHPLVRRTFPPDVVDTLTQRWAGRERYLNALDLLPRTMCHGDAFRRNLLVRCDAEGREQTVAIDWAIVGMGWIGHDIMVLIGSSLAWREVDPSKARELDKIVFEGYLDGLHDAGWEGDRRQVRLGTTAMRAIRGLGSLSGLLGRLLDEDKCAQLAAAMGFSPEGLADHLAALARNDPLAYWEQEARELVDALQ